MARGFGSTFGVGSTDSIHTGYSTAIAAKKTYSVWIWINGTGASAKGRIFDASNSSNPQSGNPNFTFNGTGNIQYAESFTGSNATWHVTPPSFSAWHHMALVYDASSTSNKPIFYVDGAAVSVTTDVAPVGSYSVIGAPVYIGNLSAGTRNWDGIVAEFALWNGTLLTASEIAALAKGAPPLWVRNNALSVYLPLFGQQANEPDWASRGVQTITGTAKRNHAPVSLWQQPATIMPALSISASITGAQMNNAGALALTSKVSASIAAAQQTDFATLSLTKSVAAAIQAYQGPDTGSLTLYEINVAALAALQQMNYAASTSALAQAGFARLAEAQFNSVVMTDAQLYTATLSDKALASVSLTDQRP